MKKKIHVVHIIPTLTFGGAERFVVDVANHLDPDRFRVSVILFSEEKPLANQLNSSVAVHIIPKKGKLSLRLFFQLRHALQELQPDIVHTHLFGGDVWGRVAARSLGIDVVTTEHNTNKQESWGKHQIKRWLKHFSLLYTAPSAIVQKYLRSIYHVTRPIEVIRHGVDLQRFSEGTKPFQQSPVRFGIIARLTNQKGHDIALKALASIQEYLWTCDIVGDGEDHAQLEGLAAQLGISGRVRFLGPKENIPDVMTTLDVLLLPSRWEGLGIVLMEAMVVGRLVIASRVGGIPEVVEDKKTGILVDPEDVDALAEALRMVFVDRGQVLRLADAGKMVAQKEFGIDHMIHSYERIYQDIVEEHSL